MPRSKKPKTNKCEICKQDKGPLGLTVFRGLPVCEYCLNLTEAEDLQDLHNRQFVTVGASSALGWAEGVNGTTRGTPTAGPVQVEQ